MDTQPIKLATPVTGYSVFERNQVLTHDHLNSISTYADYQQRLTRTLLLGAGIVCGLKVIFRKENVVVTKGSGITSDGDLLQLGEDLVLTGVSPFADKDANYKSFSSLVGDSDANARIWVFSNDTTDVGFTKVADFFKGNNNAADMVVLLYVNQYVKATDDCSSDECDNNAKMATNELKFVVMNKADYDKIAVKGGCCTENYFELPEVGLPRVLLNENDALFSNDDLKKVYGTAINGGLTAMREPLQKAAAIAGLLFTCYALNGNSHADQIPDRTDASGSVTADIDSIKALLGVGKSDIDVANAFAKKVKTELVSNQQGIQYLHSFIKEIGEAYNEFKESVFDLCYGCCIAPEAFPKHIALGLAISDDSTLSHQYRQCFIESPILNNRDEDVLAALRFFARLAQMIATFSIPGKATIRVTPSVAVNEVLGKRSIPFYYDAGQVSQNWDPEKARRNKAMTLLSYNAEKYSKLPHVTDPLSFGIDKYNFFRIEGHIGQDYDSAFKTIDGLRNKFDLPFDLAAVQLQKDRITITPVKPLRPHYLDVLYEKERLQWNTKLDHLQLYNNTVVAQLPTDDELTKEGVTKDYGDAKTLKATLLTRKAEMDTHIATARTALAQPMTEAFARVDWDQLHLNIANTGTQISSNSKLFTKAAFRTPIEHLGISDNARLVDWIGKLKLVQQDKQKDGYVFSSFLKQNPAMLHHGGVSQGGTFVLVYDTVNNVRTVVADFYLPYICKEELVDTQVPPMVAPANPTRPIDNGIIKDIIKKPLFNEDLVKLNLDFSVVKSDVTFTKTKAINAENLINQKVNDFEGRFVGFSSNLVGIDSKINAKADEVRKDVSAVKADVDKQVKGLTDNYQTTFGSLLNSYQTVLTKTPVKGLSVADRVSDLVNMTDDDLKELQLPDADLRVLKAQIGVFKQNITPLKITRTIIK
ncbi:MAG: hypothetical protein ABIX01_20625 [Chitinophagaceae bacterium]